MLLPEEFTIELKSTMKKSIPDHYQLDNRGRIKPQKLHKNAF
jgi:hypothetical protein